MVQAPARDFGIMRAADKSENLKLKVLIVKSFICVKLEIS